MTDLIFWGATGQSRVLKECLEGSQYRLVAIFDSRPVSSPFPAVPCYLGRPGFDAWVAKYGDVTAVRSCVAIGGPLGAERLAIQRMLGAEGILPLTVIHRTAFVASDAVLGPGCQILAMSAVCANVRLGEASIVNTMASVDHCCTVGEGSHIGPGARLTGEVVVGSNVFIGAGAVILPRISIGDSAVVGAGAVVTHNVAAGAVVRGIPAR